MKPRPPTLRTKKRYVLARIDPPGIETAPRDLYYCLLESFTSLFGDALAAEAGIVLVSCESGYAEIRCTRGLEHQVRTALSTITSVEGRKVAVRSLVTSGTLQALRKRRAAILLPQTEEYGEWEIAGRVYSSRRYQGQKVDLVEKGIKGQELLFLTQDDREEF
jgi:ribonuclease P/MRP protein subunit POP5